MPRQMLSGRLLLLMGPRWQTDRSWPVLVGSHGRSSIGLHYGTDLIPSICVTSWSVRSDVNVNSAVLGHSAVNIRKSHRTVVSVKCSRRNTPAADGAAHVRRRAMGTNEKVAVVSVRR